MVRVVFFGRIADVVGREKTVALNPAGETVRMLAERLAGEEPALRSTLSSMRVKFAVNDAIVPEDRIVADGDEIAVLPPFSGG